MGSIPLPALHIQPPPAPENPVDQFGRILQLRNALQEAPLRQQALQQQVQQGQIGMQEAQQGQRDQEAFRAAMADPSLQGKTLSAIADHLAKTGNASPQMWQSLKKADVEQRQSLATLDKDQLANFKAAHSATQELYNNVMNLPDDQLAQNWPQIAQQYDSIPGNNKMPLDPQKPLSKDQLKAFGPFISMHGAYLDEAMGMEKTQAQTAGEQATAEKTQLENAQIKQYGGLSGPAQDAKYQFLQKKMTLGQPITIDDQAWIKGYEKQKLLVPKTTAEIRMEGMGQNREYPVYDKKQGATVMVTPNEINRAAKEEPGRYTAASYTPESVGAKKATEYFVSGKGGQQLTAFNTAMQHLDLLDKLGGDLNNTDLQVANKAKQAWAEQTGSPAPANFEAAKNAMAGEVAAALKASGATDQEIAKVDTTFSRSQSPAQLKGAINTYRTLLQSKEKNLQQQYEQGKQGKPNFGGAPSGGTVTMRAPNGQTKSVSPDQVEHYKKLGAMVVE